MAKGSITDVKLQAREQRFIAQCYLMQNLDQILESPKRTYKHFLCIDDDSSTALGRLLSKSKAEEFLEFVRPEELSALVPKIRLFKVDYDAKTGGKRESELHFDDFMSKSEIKNITSSRMGRGSGIGLQDFTYEFIGKNFASAKRIIKVSMKILFSKIDDLKRGGTGDASFLDIIKPSNKTDKDGTINPYYHRVRVDFGWAVPPRCHQLFKGKKRLLKAIESASTTMYLSCRMHNLNFLQDGRIYLTAEFQGEMESVSDTFSFDILKWSKTHLALGLGGQTPEGAAQRQTEIKRLRGTLKALRKNIKNLECNIKNSRKSKKRYNEDYFKNKQSDLAAKNKTLFKTYKSLKQQKLENKIFKYEQFIRILFKQDKIYIKKIPAELLGMFNITGIGYNRKIGLQLNRKQISQILTNQNQGKVVLPDGTVKSISKCGEENKKGLVMKDLKDLGNRPNPSGYADYFYKAWNWLKSWAGNSQEKKILTKSAFLKNISVKYGLPVVDGCVKIHYFFLGDFLDIIFDKFYDNRENEHLKIRFLLGSITMPHRERGRERILNIADIPISLDFFRVWFANKVVRKERSEYFFRDFISDLIVGLVDQAVNLDCFQPPRTKSSKGRKKDRKQKMTSKITMFTLPGRGKGGRKDPIGEFNVPYSQVPYGSVSTIMSKKFDLRYLDWSRAYRPQDIKAAKTFAIKYAKKYSSSKRKKAFQIKKLKKQGFSPIHYTYLFIHATDEPAFYRRTVNYFRDVADGIYHFYLGSNTGLVKEINFEQSNIKGMAESRMMGTSLEWTKRLYNAKIKMFGNAMFYPGMKIYINPITIGLGRPDNEESIASFIGLGGYYIINKVEGNIASGKYETILSCIWESKGNGYGKKHEARKPDKTSCGGS